MIKKRPLVTVVPEPRNSLSFLGYRDGSVFQVLFIEYKFGDIYNHG